MATLNGRVTYSSLSNVAKSNAIPNGEDDCDSLWAIPNGSAPFHTSSKFPVESEDFTDDGYDSSEEFDNPEQNSVRPEVNLKNVLNGMFAILTGSNKSSDVSSDKQVPSSNVSFLGSEKNGDTYLHSSVYIPSAPPLLEPNMINYNAYKDVLEAEPPEWLPDSSSSICMQCTAPFTAITRGRHHCRFCGGIFCRACSKGRCLMPVKFRERNPQRVCDACYDRLDPLQGILINSTSNAVQRAKHDVMDWTSTRGWLNLPIGMSMEYEIYKASKTLRGYFQVCLLCILVVQGSHDNLNCNSIVVLISEIY